MAMVNMQMSAEEAREMTQPTADDAPRYPYGLCICLDDDALEKLGLTQLPAVGTAMTLTARVEVSSTSAYQTRGGESEARLELQITDMELGTAPASANAVNTLYGD